MRRKGVRKKDMIVKKQVVRFYIHDVYGLRVPKGLPFDLDHFLKIQLAHMAKQAKIKGLRTMSADLIPYLIPYQKEKK